jgi:hypothetical protein
MDYYPALLNKNQKEVRKAHSTQSEGKGWGTYVV